MSHTGRFLTALFLLLLAVTLAYADETDVPPANDPLEDPADDPLFDDPLFADPFAVSDDSNEELDDFFLDPFGDADEAADNADDSGTATGGDAANGGNADLLLEGDLFAVDDLDSLFGGDEIIEDAAEPAPGEAAPADDLLVTEGVRWGGRVSGSVSADYGWDDVWTSEWALADPTSESLEPSVGVNLYFDARPDQDFRAFGKLNIQTTSTGGFNLAGLAFAAGGIDANLPDGWTSEENEDGDTEILNEDGEIVITIPAADEGDEEPAEEEPEEEEDEGAVGQAPGLSISFPELFADYVWTDRLFFRFGKHTIKWGTGYFFSPADVLNLTAVDAEDPTADREGPVSLRIQYPFGITGNAYLYTIMNSGAEPLDVAVAPKIEFALGSGEVGIGGYYQRTIAPRLVVLGSASLGEIDLFGEGVLQLGSDRIFVTPSRDQGAAEEDPEDDLELVLDTYEQPDALFAQATGGLRYLKEWEDVVSLVLVAQYFFNGEGYSNEVPELRTAAARLLGNADENGLAISNAAEQPEGYEDPPALGIGDLTNWGRHYLGATVALSSIFGSDLGLTAFCLVNLNDWSGIVTPALSWSFLDRFSLSAAARFTFGGPDGEYTNPAALLSSEPAEPTFGLTVSISMPGGSF